MSIAQQTLLLIAAAGCLHGQSMQDPPQGVLDIRTDARLVNVPFRVQDHEGNIVAGLTRQDFEILDNGRPQPISHFAEEDSVPLTFEVLLEGRARSCQCLDQYLTAEKEAIQHFFTKFVRPSDAVLLASFGDGSLRVWQNYTSSMAVLGAALTRMAPKPRSTATSLFESVYGLATSSQADSPGRKLMLVLSTGLDYRTAKLSTAVKAARAAETTVVGLLYLDDSTLDCFLTNMAKGDAKSLYSGWKDNGTSNLRWLSQLTGGRFFEPGGKESLDTFLATTIAQARHQYAIGYPPPEPGKRSQFHRIEVHCRTHGVKVVARPGYYGDAL